MEKRVALVVACALICLVPASATASSRPSLPAAKHALRVDLARGFAIQHVHASCRRRTSAKVRCRWRGRRGGTPYRGRATVLRAGRSISVQLGGVRRG